MRDLLECPQRKSVLIPFRVLVSGGTPTMDEGGTWLAVVDNGAGDFNLNFTSQLGSSSRLPTVVGVVVESDSASNEFIANVVSSTLLVSGFEVIINDDAGTATDNLNFSGAVIWYGSADER